MMPWSIGWLTLVEFNGKNSILILLNTVISEQLSMKEHGTIINEREKFTLFFLLVVSSIFK